MKTTMIRPMKRLLDQLGVEHKPIKPYTPKHNGKVERSHRNDNKRFYKMLNFCSLDDLNHQMRAYLKRSNDIPSRSLNWLSPKEVRKKLTSIKTVSNTLIIGYTMPIIYLIFFASHHLQLNNLEVFIFTELLL